MKKYLTYFNMATRSMYAYKADFFLYMAINTVFFYVSIALWVAVFKSSGNAEIGNYTLANTITYYLITGLLFRLDLSNSIFLGEEIWSGFYTNDLIKPWNPVLAQFLASLSDLFIGMLSYLPFFVIMAVTSFKYINLPTLLNFLWFILVVILSLIMNFCFNLILHSSTFHFGDQQKQIELINYITAFLAGAFVPIAFLSGWVKTVFTVLPFKFLFFAPTEIFLGKVSPAQSFRYILEIIIWIAVFYGLFRLVYGSGIKKYTGTGR